MYLALNALAIDSCVVGKSNLYRRSQVQFLTGTLKPRQEGSTEPSGLASFGRFLAEDNMIASALWHELDLRHSLSCDVAQNVIGDMPLSAYIQRRIRWIRVRKHMVLAATLLEPFTELCMLTLISSWALHRLLSFPRWIFIPLQLICWLWVDLDVYRSLGGQPVPSQDRLLFFLSWCLRELFAFPIWLVAVTGDIVEWRGVRYRVLRNGEVERADSSRSGALLKGVNLVPRALSSVWRPKYSAVPTESGPE
jgi:ceramide glucosyltransferase